MTPSRVWTQGGVALLSLSLGLLISSASAAPLSDRAVTIYQRTRTFRVPFNLNPADQAKRKELQLWVSSDSGVSWKPKDSIAPTQSYFMFEAPEDGEFWLAVRTVDFEGRVYPRTNDQIVPSMRVIVDTIPPKLTIKPEERSASLASLRWEIHEEHPNLESLTFEYQVEGTKKWLPAPKPKPGWNGVATWDTGFSERVTVKAVVADRAGNKSEIMVKLAGTPFDGALMAANLAAQARSKEAARSASEGKLSSSKVERATVASAQAANAKAKALARTVDRPDGGSRPLLDLQATNAATSPTRPEIEDSRVQRSVARPETEDLDSPRRRLVAPATGSGRSRLASSEPPTTKPDTKDEPPASSQTGRLRGLIEGSEVAAQKLGTSIKRSFTANSPSKLMNSAGTEGSDPAEDHMLGKVVEDQDRDRTNRRASRVDDPETAQAALKGSSPADRPDKAKAPAGNQEIPRLQVATPRFSLDYEAEDFGPNGPVVIELWVTKDGGRTWTKRGADADLKPPIDVDLKANGSYGVSLIARDRLGRGERPPSSGDLPQLWVEVGGHAPVANASGASRSTGLLQRVFGR
ncbi:hypothetical protein [Singulisphaera sp. PoT]|uniref:hypothetical protein n=1 Tax=Singulisphaera sp. PoT TaxID=3411797 RepID=UPI003BF57C0B